MNIIKMNVSDAVASAIDNDLQAIKKRMKQLKLSIPCEKIRVISLGHGDELPAELDCDIKPVPGKRPAGFNRLCEWERQKQSYQLIQDESYIWCIGGGDSGAYYGFIEAMQCLTGVIFSGVRDEDIIFAEPKPLPATVIKPRFAFRCRDGLGPGGMDQAFFQWLGRNRYNMWRRNSSCWEQQYPAEQKKAVLEYCKMYSIQLTLGDHAMDLWLPEEEFTQHPEWFGMRDGSRARKAVVKMPDCPTLAAKVPIQPCYSNPKLQQYIVNRMADHINTIPEMDMFGLWPHDGVNNWCQCPECLKKTPFEHIHHLAMLLQDHIPDTMPIELIAYSNLLNPPKNSLPDNDRIFIMLCPYLRHYNHHIYDPGGPELTTGVNYPEPDRINPVDEREYGELFDIWYQASRECGAELAIFEYGATFYDETRRTDRTRYFYNPPADIIRDELSWYKERNIDLFYLCGYYRGWPDLFTEYSLAMMLWQECPNIDTLEEDYYTALLGNAGGVVKDVLLDVRRELLSQDTNCEHTHKLKSIVADYPDSEVCQAYQVWCDYIQMGKKSWKLESVRDNQGVINQEEEIEQLLDKHKEMLATRLTPGALCYTAINKKRAKERLENLMSKDYVL